ncbi:MAG: glycoside hydrolase family 28 protein, partial [Clostridiales bacterium]|nr:glycoside hydrolase family 28 protein [Clostridiales bacterium]
MNTIIFDDEITFWWDIDEYQDAKTYSFYLDGKLHGETSKTHYTFASLKEKTTYRIRMDAGENSREFTLSTRAKKRRLDITKAPYFAVGDGKTLNTSSIQKALDDCTENDCVYIPQGTFLTGALDMHAGSELYVEKGGGLKGSEQPEDYLPKIRSRFEGIEQDCYRSLLNIGRLDYTAGYTTGNVVIRGKGTIFGGGDPLCSAIIQAETIALKKFLEENQEYVKTCETPHTIAGRARGRLIHICNAENVIIGGLTLGYGASWNIHFTYSKNILTYACRILSADWESDDGAWKMQEVENGDGWDPDSSED